MCVSGNAETGLKISLIRHYYCNVVNRTLNFPNCELHTNNVCVSCSCEKTNSRAIGMRRKLHLLGDVYQNRHPQDINVARSVYYRFPESVSATKWQETSMIERQLGDLVSLQTGCEDLGNATPWPSDAGRPGIGCLDPDPLKA